LYTAFRLIKRNMLSNVPIRIFTEKKYLLSLQFVELVNLFAHLSNNIVVLLAEVSESSLMLDGGLLEVTTQLRELSLPFLVELDLGGCGATGFLKTFSQFFKFAGKVGTLLFSLQKNPTVQCRNVSHFL